MTTGQTDSRRTLISERATLSGEGKLAWKLRSRGDQQIEIEEKPEITGLGGEPGLEIRTRNRSDGSFSYLRGEFTLLPSECEGVVSFAVQLGLEAAPGVLVLVELYEEAKFLNEVMAVRRSIGVSDEAVQANLVVDFNELPARRAPIYGFVQICLPTVAGAVVSVGHTFAIAADQKSDLKRLRIRFDAVGNQTKASSRLRVWKFVEVLRRDFHDVRVGGTAKEVDLYFCQKVRPFESVAAIRKASPGAVIIYDFDDNFVLEEQGVLPEFLAFINLVDVVTCGSEYLAETVRRWHRNVFVLENPLDIPADAPCRTPTGQLTKIGWFGAPEGLPELDKVNLTGVTTVTKGGDIEFDLRTIDRDLTGFDLLVFPVEETPWNLAKNANRMLKALALGVPVLVSATPEQRRIAELAGLPSECLVGPQDNWQKAVERLPARYSEVENLTLQARERVLQTHSPEKILTGLLDHVRETTSGLTAPRTFSTPVLQQIAVLIVDGSLDGRGVSTLEHSPVHWPDFHSVHLFSARKTGNELFHLKRPNFHVTDGSYLALFEAADRAMEECSAEYFLIIPAGTALAFGFGEQLAVHREPITLFVRNEYCRAALVGDYGMPRLRELFLHLVVLGPLLVRTEWARQNRTSWQSTYELWSWVTTVKALATDNLRLIDLPFAFDSLPRAELNVARQYAAWLAENDPPAARELPNLPTQWNRILTDIVAEAAAEVTDDFPSIVAHLHSRYTATRQKLASVEAELREAKKKEC